MSLVSATNQTNTLSTSDFEMVGVFITDIIMDVFVKCHTTDTLEYLVTFHPQ